MVSTRGKIAEKNKCKQQAKSQGPLCQDATRLHDLAQETHAIGLNGVGQTINVSSVGTARGLRRRKHESKADMGERTILEVRDSPMPPAVMGIEYPKRQTRTTPEEASGETSGSTNVAQAMQPCGHHCAKGKSVAVDCILPSGVQIDCAGCLENFLKQTDILFTIFQLTFEEQDAERAAHPALGFDTTQGLESTMDGYALQGGLATELPAPGDIPPIADSSKSHLNAKKKGKSVRGRPRTNGRFIPGPRLAFEAPSILEPTIAEEGTPPSARALDVVVSDDGLVDVSPEESIHVRAPELSRASTYSLSTHVDFRSAPSAASLSPGVEEGTQDSPMHISSSTTPQENSTNYTLSPPTLALQERNPRKRNLTEKARELLATADTDTGVSKQAVKQARTVPTATKLGVGDTTQQVDTNPAPPDQSITSCPMEPPSSKRKGHQSHAEPPTKRQKTPDVMSSQPPVGKRRPGRPRKPRPGDDTPSTIFVGTSTTIPDAEGSVSGRSVTTRSASTGSFQRSPSSPIYGPEFRLVYASKLPAIPIAPAAKLEVSTPEPEKRRRGRPPKVTVEKPIPIVPVPIQPKPAANGDISISATADVSSGLGYSPQAPAPSEPKKRGRPRKPQITLDRSPVVALAGRSLTSMSASLPPSTIPASDASEVGNLTVLSDDTIVIEEVDSPPVVAPSTAAPTRMMPFSPQKRHINLIVRDSAKVIPRHGNPPTSGDSTETDEDNAEQALKNKASDRLTAVNGVSKTTTPAASSLLANGAQQEPTIMHPPVSAKPASIADAVANISTDSEQSSSTSEDDTEEDETFHPRRNWVAVNSGSSASTPKAITKTKSGGPVGGRGSGRGRGRGSTPVGGGAAGLKTKSDGVKMEKGQQTLGSFFLKPLAVGVPIQQPVVPAAGIEYAGLVVKRGGKWGTGTGRMQNENVDVEMKDT